MSATTYLVGDVFDRVAEIPDGSVDLVVTSPPFLALRSYLPADHPDKGKEIGSETTPAEFLTTLLELTAEWGRVLAPHGSLAVELGDTYAGSGRAGGDYNPDGLRDGQQRFDGTAAKARRTNGDYPVRDDHPRPARDRVRKTPAGWPMEKSLCFIPELYGACLAYGRNLLTGEPSPAGQWRIRNLVAWVRPNPPVGALADKFRPATSYITVATRARDRWFDLDAVRTPHKSEHRKVILGKVDTRDAARGAVGLSSANGNGENNPAGAPPLDWWEITPGGYSGAHYAVWPPELCKRLIESMCPRKVCTTCGQPSRRIVEAEPSPLRPEDRVQRTDGDAGRSSVRPNGKTHMGLERKATTLGWSDCGHDTWRPGLVLDPFVGSGTTLAVCSGMGRASIGVDIDYTNAALAMDRVGMWLHVEWPDPDLKLLEHRALGPGSPHPAVYDPWRHQLDHVRAELVAWLIAAWVASVAVALGVALDYPERIDPPPARRSRAAVTMAGQGGLFGGAPLPAPAESATVRNDPDWGGYRS